VETETVVYIVDSDEVIREALGALVTTYGVAVKVFPDAERLLHSGLLCSETQGCLMAECNLSGLSGLVLPRQVRAQGFVGPVYIMIDKLTETVRQKALKFGATDVVEKRAINTFLTARVSEWLVGEPN